MKLPKQRPGWLVWAIRPNGATVLRAICTTEQCAKHYKEYLLKAEGAERVYIEGSRLNHLYFGIMERGGPDPKKVKAALAAARKVYRKAR
jgi:hypothetical protein